MAENNEENKKGGIVKIAIFAGAGLVLLGIGLGIGALIFGGGSEPDPSAEVSEILAYRCFAWCTHHCIHYCTHHRLHFHCILRNKGFRQFG